MAKLTRDDLYSLEDYAEMRDDFRARVMAHKKNRRLELGNHVILHFEDQLIMHYQVQEMLRAEKIFDAKGIEELVWVRVDGHDKVFPVADEDMDRTTEDKTSAVHFLRFELTPEMIAAFKGGATLDAGIDHENYTCSVHPVAANITASLVEDLD